MRLRATVLLVTAICTVTAVHAADQSLRRPANLHEEAATARSGSHMVSWVVLSNSYVELDEETLRAKLDEVFPGQFLPPRDDGSYVVDGPVPGAQFLIQSRVPGASGLFMLNSVPGPYTEFSSFANAIKDRAMRRRARAQQSWLSIDLTLKHSNATEDDAYRFIRRALAKLAPPDAAYLVHPTRDIVLTFDKELRHRLERGEDVP